MSSPSDLPPRPKPLTLVFAAVPFVALCFTVKGWDRIEPRIGGVPFNLCWIVVWIVLTSACIGLAHWSERRPVRRSPGEGGR